MDKLPGDVCCNCKHFRMWKPQPTWCVELKQTVEPLAFGCGKYCLRKGLASI